MAESQSSSSNKTRKGTKGEMVAVEQGATVIDPTGATLTMGGEWYVLDQVGRHVVGGVDYDVTEPKKG